MTFNVWLRRAAVTDDPVGDFIADARRDRTFPRGIRSYGQLRNYLLYRDGVCPEALASLPAVWERYCEQC